MALNSPDYDMEFIMQQIADESNTFWMLLERLIADTDTEYPTNELWLGTLSLGKDNIAIQVKLTVRQEAKHFIDEE